MDFKELDYKCFNFINNKVQQYPLIDNVMIILAEYVQYAFGLLIILLWIKNKTNYRVIAFQTLFAIILAYSINRIVEMFIYRERPLFHTVLNNWLIILLILLFQVIMQRLLL